MTTGVLLLHLLLLGNPANDSIPGQKISCRFSDTPFSEFCATIHRETGITVFYRQFWVERIRVTLSADSISIMEAVKLALEGSGLSVSYWHRNLVISPHNPLIGQLPDFDHRNAQSIIRDKLKNTTESEDRYLTGRKSDAMSTLIIGKPGRKKTSAKATIQGRITEEESGEPAIGATLFVEETKTGAATDLNGFLTIMLLPGKYNVLFEHIGLEKKKYGLEVYSDGDFAIQMKKSFVQIKEVVVYGDRQMSIKLKDPGLEKLSIKSIRSIPMLMGERDILKVSQLLPGIVSVGEGAAGINVRGGSSDQNAFYINKIPIYNTSHLFGFFPAFNSEIIKDFSVYKGHIPAQYGGRLSSVFNIVSRQGNRKKFMAHGGISPVAANIVVEGPLKMDTASFLFSARSSYSDWILGRIKDPDIWNSKAAFSDFTASLNYDIVKTQVSLFAYYSSDRFELSDINRYKYSNRGMSLNFSHSYSNSLRADYTLVASQYGFSTVDVQEISKAFEHSYQIAQYEARADLNQVTGDKNTLEYGADFIRYNLDRGSVNPFGITSLRKPVLLGKEQAFEGSVYVADLYEILPWLTLNIGLRYSVYCPIGPKTVYKYSEGTAMLERNITDSLVFMNNQPIKWYRTPQVRAAISFETDVNGSVKFSFNQMSQNLFMLSNTVSIAPNTQWKIADYYVRPSKSNQYSAGVFRKMPESGWETSVEFYYKQTENFPEFKDGADFLNNPLIETEILQGDQASYGIELMIKRIARKVEGWLSYTYSSSRVQINGKENWQKVNGGKSYPSNYDIPHVMNAVINYHINRRLTVSAVITYQTGKPVTFPTSVYYIEGIAYQDFSERNQYRIPGYFRSDLSVNLEGNLKKNKLIHSSVAFNLYNLTGRDNPYSVYFRTENGRIRGYQYSVISVPIFTATWIFKLGNYATD